jgi:hypothetical protein
MRPQGYLGRAFGMRHSDLQLPTKITHWGHDDILEALARRGEDLVGDLMLGVGSFERYQSIEKKSEIISQAQPETHYVSYARAAEEGELPGSSVGGENPKFIASLQDENGTLKQVLVKFSPAGESFAAERWRDLLISEAVALDVLRENRILAADSRLLEAGGRTFLETQRFDRIGRRGRQGVISLAALENEWVSQRGNWSISAIALEQEKIISTDDLKTIQKLECFGRLIANSDRHSGNLSFFWSIEKKRVKLAPVYDMLPMLFAPNSRGEEVHRKIQLPTYDDPLIDTWKQMLPLGIYYWQRIRETSSISMKFKKISEETLNMLLNY